MALNVGLVVSVDNMEGCKRIREKRGEINNMKAHIIND
jgi:hypothetical protein